MSDVQEMYPYLRVRGAAAAIEFYGRAFGAQELFRLTAPDGRIGHVQLKFGTSTIMLGEEYPERGVRGPLALGGTSVGIHLHVSDVDRAFEQATRAGAEVVMPPRNQFWGERMAVVRDPFGHEWLLGGHLEDVSPEEMQSRYSEVQPG
ncbi:MAG TPA: VOC family protein [Steroidobacteraceae bacterium]|nr:VOC family protein [Steroidobacteraceae bacterium]